MNKATANAKNLIDAIMAQKKDGMWWPGNRQGSFAIVSSNGVLYAGNSEGCYIPVGEVLDSNDTQSVFSAKARDALLSFLREIRKRGKNNVDIVIGTSDTEFYAGSMKASIASNGYGAIPVRTVSIKQDSIYVFDKETMDDVFSSLTCASYFVSDDIARVSLFQIYVSDDGTICASDGYSAFCERNVMQGYSFRFIPAWKNVIHYLRKMKDVPPVITLSGQTPVFVGSVYISDFVVGTTIKCDYPGNVLDVTKKSHWTGDGYIDCGQISTHTILSAVSRSKKKDKVVFVISNNDGKCYARYSILRDLGSGYKPVMSLDKPPNGDDVIAGFSADVLTKNRISALIERGIESMSVIRTKPQSVYGAYGHILVGSSNDGKASAVFMGLEETYEEL